MYLNYIEFDLSAIDSTALIIVFVGLIIVFFVLTLIYLFFKYILPFILESLILFKAKREGNMNLTSDSLRIPAGDTAAIAMALYLHLSDMHDDESNIITIKRVSRTYSPWSSKLYSMKNKAF